MVSNAAGTVTSDLASLLVSDFVAAHTNDGMQYVSPGTTTMVCQVSYGLGRQLLALLWRPALPAGWSLLDASGQGGPEVQGGEIIFSGSLANNPLSFSYTVAIPDGQTGSKQVGGTVEYLLNEMVNPAVVSAMPNPLLLTTPRLFHRADYRESYWNIDGPEVSRVLAYWRALAYHLDPVGLDGYAAGAGETNGPLHSADYRVAFWGIDGTEVNRVLAYWRTNGYHLDPEGFDGYAPGLDGAGAKARIASVVMPGRLSR